MKLLHALLLSLLVLTPSGADAAGARLKLKLFHRGGAAPVADLVPGVLPPSSGGITNAGWATTTISPVAYGNPAAYGYARTTMTSFTTIPFSTNPATLSALSFHLPSNEEYDAGIKSNMNYVAVTCDGGPLSYRYAMAYNPDTSTTEYFWPITPSVAVWPDGLHECRLIAVPLTGQAKVLQGDRSDGNGSLARSVFFFTNFGGSFTPLTRYVERSGANTTNCGQAPGVNPCLTTSYALTRMAAVRSDLGGSQVCLGPAPIDNPHPWGAATGNTVRVATNQYVTVSGCGLPRNQVYVKSSDDTGSTSGLRTRKLRAYEVTMIGEPFWGGSTGTGSSAPILWLDHISMEGKGALVTGFITDDTDGGLYITDSSFEEIGNARPGNIFRNSQINQIGGDSFTGGRLVINSTVSNANDRTYATGNSLIGSNIVTNVSNFARLRLGAPIEFCGRSGTDFVSITAMDPIAQTITFNKTCLTALVGSTIFSAKHSDIVQYGGSVFTNIIFYNMTAVDSIWGAGWFTDRAGTQVNDIALVNTQWNNKTEPNSFSIAQFNRPVSNALFLNSTWVGSRVYDSPGNFTAVDFSWIDNVCSSTRAMPAGVYQRGSPTCVP